MKFDKINDIITNNFRVLALTCKYIFSDPEQHFIKGARRHTPAIQAKNVDVHHRLLDVSKFQRYGSTVDFKCRAASMEQQGSFIYASMHGPSVMTRK